jgi:hypothetical protein
MELRIFFQSPLLHVSPQDGERENVKGKIYNIQSDEVRQEDELKGDDDGYKHTSMPFSSIT